MSDLYLSVSDAALRERLTALWPAPQRVRPTPWTQALPRMKGGRAAPSAVWVLEVDASHGPGLQALRQAWSGGLPDARVLVLLPEAWHSQAPAWLDSGVDRCLLLPCDPAVVAAMVLALARPLRPPVCEISQWASLCFDHRAMTLYQGDQRIELTQREAEVMSLLMRRTGKIVSCQELLQHLGRGPSGPFRTSMVQLYVHRVNRKIAPHGLHIDCVKRVGYVLRARSEDPAHPLWTAWAASLNARQAVRPQQIFQ